MALELLAGPIAITDATGTVLTPHNRQEAFYDDSLGLCTHDGTLDGHCIIQLDGRAYLRSEATHVYRFILDLQHLGEYLAGKSTAAEVLYVFDKHAGVLGEVVIAGSAEMVFTQVRAMDRYLYVNYGTVRFKPLDDSAAWIIEATLIGAGTGDPFVSCTRINGVLCLVYDGGQIIYYDTIAKQQYPGGGFIGANGGAWYSRKHDIFIALVSNQIKIFANAVRPAALSNPVAETALAKGKVSRIKVRLTGANGEACADELIAWSMSGAGSLAYPQSSTDANGWAYNDYRAPVIGLGSATINAEARF